MLQRIEISPVEPLASDTAMLHLRDVGQDELQALSELCLRSKAVWGYDEPFMVACRAELTLLPAELGFTHLQVAERDRTVLGMAQIKIAGMHADLLKLFVEPGQMRSGVGRLLLRWAVVTARGLGASRMIIEADPGAAPFYERLGARRTGFAASQSIVGRMLPRFQLDLE